MQPNPASQNVPRTNILDIVQAFFTGVWYRVRYFSDIQLWTPVNIDQ
jgi:hypothetical protein